MEGWVWTPRSGVGVSLLGKGVVEVEGGEWVWTPRSGVGVGLLGRGVVEVEGGEWVWTPWRGVGVGLLGRGVVEVEGGRVSLDTAKRCRREFVGEIGVIKRKMGCILRGQMIVYNEIYRKECFRA